MGAAEIEYQRRQPKAAATLKKLISLQPQNSIAHAMLAVVLAEGGDFSQALADFEKARDQIAANAGFAQLYAQCLFLVGRHKEAAVQFQRLLDAAPQHEGLRFNLAVALYASRDYAGAAATVAPLTAAALPTFDALSLLADAYEMDARTPEALESLKRAAKLYPKEERIYIQYAELCLSHGNNGLGLEILEAGLAQIADSVRILTTQGLLFGMQGRYEEADRKLQAAQRIGVEQEIVALGKALTLSGTGRTAEAAAHLRTLLAKQPGDADLNLLFGKVLVSQGVEAASAGFREAKTAFERVITIRPGDVEARVELAKLLMTEAKVSEATTHIKRAAELAPGDQKVLYQLVRVLTRAGRTDEAAAAKVMLQSALQREGDRSMKLDDYRLVKVPDPGRGK
jgi:tetratricopeptide (TPR) repeat protein